MKYDYDEYKDKISQFRVEFQNKRIVQSKLRNNEFFQKSACSIELFNEWISDSSNLDRWNDMLNYFDSEDELWYYIRYPNDRPDKHICDTCGKEISFDRWKIYTKRDIIHTCSEECAKKHRVLSAKKTCIEKYGWENAFQAHRNPDSKKHYYCKFCGKELNEKSNYCNDDCRKNKKSKEIQDKIDEYNKNPKRCEVCGNIISYEHKKYKTCSEKCGYELTHIKTRQILFEKYGVYHAFQVNEIRDKYKKTCLERYGTENPSSSLEIRNKVKKTNLERWGYENPRQSPEIASKVMNTCKEKYGVLCPFNINQEEKIEKSIETKYKRYGNLAVNCHRYSYDNLRFDSREELYFYIYNKEILSLNIKRGPTFEYMLDNKIHRYECDFEVNDLYFEIKSSHLMKDGKLYFPYKENKINKQRLWDAKSECMQKNNVKIILTDSDEMKEIIKKVDNKFTKDYVELFNIHKEFPYPNDKFSDTSDLGLIHHFHKSIYEGCRKGKPSPIEGWYNKSLVKEVALNRLKYVGFCTPANILQGFNVTLKAPKVSTFSPYIAKDLIIKYLNEIETIVDPFSGFSGRLLGCENCHKKYYGFDINEKHVNESNEIIKFRNYRNSIIQVRDILSEFPIESYDALFTCPPYGGKEHWNKDNDEIEKSCDEWIDICLQKFSCKKYLFVVDKTEKYKEFIVETLSKKSHFGERKEFVILINGDKK